MQAQDIYLVAYGIVAYGEPVGSCMSPDIEVAVDQAGGYVDFTDCSSMAFCSVPLPGFNGKGSST